MPSFAFSIHNFISSVGADAGFAAIIGLAILVLLYFAHARETANLREEAALLTQRLQQAEARVIQLIRMQAAAEPAVAEEVAVQAVAMAPFAPAAVGAPALGSATRVIALAAPVEEEAPAASEPAAAPVPAMAMAGVGAGAATPAPVAPPPASAAPAPPAAAPPILPSGAPVTPQAASAKALPGPATNAGGNGASHPPSAPVTPATSGPPLAPSSSARAQSRTFPPLELPPRRRRSRLGRGVLAALVALGVVVAAVALFAVTSIGGSSSKSPSGSPSNAPTGRRTSGAAAFKPTSVTVAVLNGTAVNQLAHRISDRLTALGYRPGTIATAANQTENSTVVAYLSGSKDRTDALHVASSLKLRRSAVQRVDQGTLQVACPTSTACTANVVVTVGADLASP